MVSQRRCHEGLLPASANSRGTSGEHKALLLSTKGAEHKAFECVLELKDRRAIFGKTFELHAMGIGLLVGDSQPRKVGVRVLEVEGIYFVIVQIPSEEDQ